MSQEIALTFSHPPIFGIEKIEIKFVATRDEQGEWQIIVAKPLRLWVVLAYRVWRKGVEIEERKVVETPIDVAWMDAADKSCWQDWCEDHFGKQAIIALEERHQELIRRTQDPLPLESRV